MSSIQAGDVVVCVDAKLRPGQSPIHISALRHLKEGRTYRVLGLTRGRGILLAGVTAANQQRGAGWMVDRFRKEEKATPGFIAQIKACRPKQRDRVPHNVEGNRD